MASGRCLMCGVLACASSLIFGRLLRRALLLVLSVLGSSVQA